MSIYVFLILSVYYVRVKHIKNTRRQKQKKNSPTQIEKGCYISVASRYSAESETYSIFYTFQMYDCTIKE